MVKLVVLFRRRPDLSESAFERHWRTTHGPLVDRLATALRLQRYSQSLVLRNESVDSLVANRGWSDSPYDGMTEIWWENEEVMTAALSSAAGQAATAELRADEMNFCDMSSVAAFLTDDHVVVADNGLREGP